MLAGPDGDEARALLSLEARLFTTFEAHSPFEAMTAFHQMMDMGPWMSLNRDDRRAYTEEALMRQFRGR